LATVLGIAEVVCADIVVVTILLIAAHTESVVAGIRLGTDIAVVTVSVLVVIQTPG